MRAYMRAKRAAAKPALAVVPPALAVQPNPAPDLPPVVPAAVPGPAAPVGNAARLATLLARGRAAAQPAPTAATADEPAPEPMTRRRWLAKSEESRRHWLKVNRPCAPDEQALADWLDALPA